MTSDFHKTATYQNAATTVADLSYPVENGESLMHLQGIGSGIAAKINEYLDELDSDYEESECSDSESIASNGDDEESDDEESDDEESDDEDDCSEDGSSTDSGYFISQNAGLAGMLYKCAEKAEDKFKCDVYTKAGDTIYNLSHVITSGKEAIKFPGIGSLSLRRLTITSTSITRHSLNVSSDLATTWQQNTNLKPTGMQRISSANSPLT